MKQLTNRYLITYSNHAILSPIILVGNNSLSKSFQPLFFLVWIYFLVSKYFKYLFIEYETNVIRKRKTPHPSYYNKTETIDRQAPECMS